MKMVNDLLACFWTAAACCRFGIGSLLPISWCGSEMTPSRPAAGCGTESGSGLPQSKLLLVIGLAAGLFIAQAGADEKLERGKDRVDVPAIGTGLSVHNLFQSGMVLQRGKPIRIWGWAEPGEKVNVAFPSARNEDSNKTIPCPVDMGSINCLRSSVRSVFVCC